MPGLGIGFAHQPVITAASRARRLGLARLEPRLLGLKDKAAFFVEIDEAGTVRRAERSLGDRGFVFILAQNAVLRCIFGRLNPEQRAKAGQEWRKAGSLAATTLAKPLCDKGFGLHCRTLPAWQGRFKWHS